MRGQPLSKFDFDQIDNLQPTQSPAAMLCYALCNADSINNQFQGDSQSDANTDPLIILHDFEYYMKCHAGRDIIEKAIYRDEMPRYWKKAIGHLAWVITEKHDLWDQWQSPYFMLPHNKTHITVDDDDHKMIVAALIHVLPAAKLQKIFQSCNATLSAEEYCNGGEIKSRALRVRQTCQTEIERRIGKDLGRNDWSEENMLCLHALTTLQLNEISGANCAAMADFIEQHKSAGEAQFAQINTDFDKGMDEILARLDKSYQNASHAMKPLEMIAEKPMRAHGLADRIHDPIDLISLLVFGEKALVTSR